MMGDNDYGNDDVETCEAIHIADYRRSARKNVNLDVGFYFPIFLSSFHRSPGCTNNITLDLT